MTHVMHSLHVAIKTATCGGIRPLSQTILKSHTHYEMASDQQQTQNIYHTAFLLQQKLTRDVVPAILEYAEFYSSSTCSENFDPSLKISQLEAPKQLIEFEIPRVKTRVLRPVRKVTFKITSHDQGFASSRDSGSWTWFTARKRMSDVALLADSMRDSRADSEDDHKVISSNPVASRLWTTHEITWRAGSLDTIEAEWVSSLVSGDRFAVYAWARYPAWVNHIAAISVTVHYVAVT
jgi:hypothetical protein